jgi:hypothetical protein
VADLGIGVYEGRKKINFFSLYVLYFFYNTVNTIKK